MDAVANCSACDQFLPTPNDLHDIKKLEELAKEKFGINKVEDLPNIHLAIANTVDG